MTPAELAAIQERAERGPYAIRVDVRDLIAHVKELREALRLAKIAFALSNTPMPGDRQAVSAARRAIAALLDAPAKDETGKGTT